MSKKIDYVASSGRLVSTQQAFDSGFTSVALPVGQTTSSFSEDQQQKLTFTVNKGEGTFKTHVY
jgi:hypothetical protein